MLLPHGTINDDYLDDEDVGIRLPILPIEFSCFLCQNVLNNPVIIDCSKSTCQAPSACNECVLTWNARFTAIVKSQTDLAALNANKDEAATIKRELGPEVPQAEGGEGAHDLYCPACGSFATRLVTNKSVANLLGALDLTKYSVQGLDHVTQIDASGDAIHADAGLDATANDSRSAPSYLSQPDAMRAAEYSMTARDLNIVTSLQRDGAVMVVLGSNEQLRIAQETNYLPLGASRVLSERLGRRLLELEQQGSTDSIYELFNTCGGHPSCPVLLPGVGDKLGAALLNFFTSLWNRKRRNPDLQDSDSLGARGYHIMLTVVSSTKTSISIGGIARVESVDLGLDISDRTDVVSKYPLVPNEVVNRFSREYTERVERRNQFNDPFTMAYGGSLARQAMADQDDSRVQDTGFEMMHRTSESAVQWFMKLRFLELWNPCIMLPYKSQPFNSIVSSAASSTASNRTHPLYSPNVASLGGNSLIPAIIAKIRASEASTAGLCEASNSSGGQTNYHQNNRERDRSRSASHQSNRSH